MYSDTDLLSFLQKITSLSIKKRLFQAIYRLYNIVITTCSKGTAEVGVPWSGQVV
jgi:hypothetical protein